MRRPSPAELGINVNHHESRRTPRRRLRGADRLIEKATRGGYLLASDIARDAAKELSAGNHSRGTAELTLAAAVMAVENVFSTRRTRIKRKTAREAELAAQETLRQDALLNEYLEGHRIGFDQGHTKGYRTGKDVANALAELRLQILTELAREQGITTGHVEAHAEEERWRQQGIVPAPPDARRMPQSPFGQPDPYDFERKQRDEDLPGYGMV